MKMSAKKIAEKFIQTCKDYGYKINLKSDSYVAISMDFTPGDSKAFDMCNSNYSGILSIIPMDYEGTVWGSVDEQEQGPSSKLGFFIMNKTGCSKSVLNTIKKMLI